MTDGASGVDVAGQGGGPPCVLVFAGADPSGGAGIAADIVAIQAQGAHALPVITALTVQDNERVHEVQPVDSALLLRQARALTARMEIAAVKIGIPGSAANARIIAALIADLRVRQPDLPVVLDPVLASGHGDLLSRDDALQALAPLLPLVTLLTPNGPEAAALSALGAGAAYAFGRQPRLGAGPAGEAGAGAEQDADAVLARRQADALRARGCAHVLLTGGHGGGDHVVNRWFGPGEQQHWHWPRLPGEFHGSGCTLASAAAALLARGYPMAQALAHAQGYCHRALAGAFAIAPGQRIPRR